MVSVDDAGCSAAHIVEFKEKVLDGPVAEFVSVSKAIGGKVAAQGEKVSTSFAQLYAFIIEASKLKAKPSDDEFAAMLGPLGAAMGQVAADMNETPPSDPFFNHLSAWGESIAGLAWVQVDSKPVSYVGDMEGAGDFFLNKVLMDFKKSDNAAQHQAWVKAIRAAFTAMKAYVKQFHTVKFNAWNKGIADSGRSPEGDAADVDDEEDGAAGGPVSAFEDLINGPLAAYLASSAKLGESVSKQAQDFQSAWKDEAAFLALVAKSQKPASTEDFQAMLGPISASMSKVPEYAASAPPSSPHFNHLTAIAESVGVLGWVAMESKLVSYVSDVEGAGEFYLNKALVACKKEANSVDHQDWVKSVRELYSELKKYVKEYHTPNLRWNSAAMANKKIAPNKAKARNMGDDDSSSPGAFLAIINAEVTTYVAASEKIGGEVASQAKNFLSAWKHEHEFLKSVATTPKPASAETVQSMVTAVAEYMGKVGEPAQNVTPRDTYYNHLTAIAESVGILGWVCVESKPVPFCSDMEGAGDFYLDKLLMSFKKEDNFKDHQAWVRSVRAMYAALKAYVKVMHTTALKWNTGLGAAVDEEYGDEEDDNGNDSVASFELIVKNQLEMYRTCSKTLGGDVGKQADIFVEAWKKEAEFLRVASATPKPPSPEGVQEMVTPIAELMGKIPDFATNVSPRDPFFNHLSAISESVGILGWVCVDSKPVPFCSDMEGAGDFYLNKLLMTFKGDPKASGHQAWVKSVRELYAELKTYVKAHHTTCLRWNTAAMTKQSKAPGSTVAESTSEGPEADFQSIIDTELAAYVSASTKVGGPVAEQASLMASAWKKEQDFLLTASKTRKPSPDEIQTMVAPIAELMGKIGELAGGVGPRDKLYNHLTAVAESVGLLGWICVDSKPVPFCTDMEGAGDFYLDKLLMACKKEADAADHQAWVKSIRALYAATKAFVKQHHMVHLKWAK